MILAFIGAVMILFALYNEELNIIALVVGIVFVILGLATMSVGDEEVRAWSNRRRYWAYGKEPDWRERTSTKTDFRKFCPGCGRPVGRNARFCSHCGRAV